MAIGQFAGLRCLNEGAIRMPGVLRNLPEGQLTLLGHCGPWTSSLTRAAMRQLPAAHLLVVAYDSLSLHAIAGSDP